MFQDYALFPHMTVAENIEYGMRVAGIDKAERVKRGSEALETVSLPGFGDRKPSSSPAASSSGSRSPARSSTARGCCCSTSRSARST